MNKLYSYGSSSKGNAYAVMFDDIFSTTIILDAGVNVFHNLQDVNRIWLQRASHVFISHEHGDHTRHLKNVLNNALLCKVVAPEKVKNELIKRGRLGAYVGRFVAFNPHWITQLPNSPLVFKCLKISHNSVANFGYQIIHKELDTGVLYITDCGSFNPEQLDLELLAKTKLFLIESNHPHDLDPSNFKFAVQTSNQGHFNNKQAEKLVEYIEQELGRDIKSQVVWIHSSAGFFDELQQCDKYGKRLKAQALECVEF
ncbi:MBL fold metallo-hydrolase [Mycoplasma sp. CSL7475-4]|uniref:MBL fold metallo-hydrolase n=1 Tax=Mycoplasma sp. CSL7475-4 TaxID=2973942 RepID=UPI00216ABDDF|nr:MBL fold metallo-hydrolase [Mycoplasma sp. CSL7475-4]MCS4536769.1 MBL fold metallo-hydrolase [Mycoplasma sp. CSL7475-4]